MPFITKLLPSKENANIPSEQQDMGFKMLSKVFSMNEDANDKFYNSCTSIIIPAMQYTSCARASAETALEMVLHTDNKVDILMPSILDAIGKLVATANNEALEEILSNQLFEVIDSVTGRKYAFNIVTMLLQVAKSGSLFPMTRMAGLNALAQLAETSPAVFKKNQLFIEECIAANMDVMLLMEDSKSDWAKSVRLRVVNKKEN